MSISSDSRFMILELLADAGRISRPGLVDIFPFSDQHINRVIHKLTLDRIIAKAGHGRYFKMALDKAIEWKLLSVNPIVIDPPTFEEEQQPAWDEDTLLDA